MTFLLLSMDRFVHLHYVLTVIRQILPDLGRITAVMPPRSTTASAAVDFLPRCPIFNTGKVLCKINAQESLGLGVTQHH